MSALSTLTQAHRFGCAAISGKNNFYARFASAAKFPTAVCGAVDAPSAFGRFRQKDPGTLGLGRIAADFGDDSRGVADESLLSISCQCTWRRNDLHPDRACIPAGGCLHGGGVHPVNEGGGVVQMESGGLRDAFSAKNRQRQLLAQVPVTPRGKQIVRCVHIDHRHWR